MLIQKSTVQLPGVIALAAAKDVLLIFPACEMTQTTLYQFFFTNLAICVPADQCLRHDLIHIPYHNHPTMKAKNWLYQI